LGRIGPQCDPATAKDGVIAEAMRLSEVERLEVAERLYESLEGPAELEQRVKAADAGQGRFIPWEEARRQIVE
jgi:putative addiction module component (TIGR02574 family)